MRSLTPVEAAVAMAIGGSVLAAAMPAFVRNLHASRLVEPIDGVSTLAARAVARAQGRPIEHAFPTSVGPTPERVPRGERVTDPPGTWDHATWRTLEFGFVVPHSFSFDFESKNTPSIATFRVRAQGDLDGDGVLSSFAISGEARAEVAPRSFPMDVHREVE
jgi:hypothetical protein